jgi:hypothetical protein
MGALAPILPFIGIGSQVLGGLQQANAAKAEGRAQAAQLQAQADAYAFNANVARENAKIVEGQTAAALNKADRERRIRLGKNIAAGGASGVGLDSFSDILQSSSAQEELNLLTIKSEGLLKERSYLQNAALDDASSLNTRNQIPLVKAATKSKSAANIIGGISGGIMSGSNMGVF